MKTNSKRKVFGDAVDLLMGDMEEVTMPRGVQMVPVKSIHPFHDHPFHLYEGERLEDMIASVKEHGVLNPVIVQKLDTGYEMLSGHNRWNAAKLAGIKEIPAIVKTDLSEEEAYVYVIETNLMQRSFSDLAISEKAAVLKARYEKGSCQGKRNDILNEIARLEGKSSDVTSGHCDQKLTTRDAIGKEYELSGSSVGRLLKLNDLIKPFKDMVDRGALYTKVALQLAFLPENEQTMVYEIIKEKKTKITIEMVMKLRSHSGALTEAMVKRYLSTEPIKKKCYKVPARIVEKYFEGMDPNKVDSIVEHDKVINLIQYLEAMNIPVYSPRSEMFFTRPEVKEILGCLIMCFPNYFLRLKTESFTYSYPDLYRYYREECVEAAQKLIKAHKDLKKWYENILRNHSQLKSNTDYAFTGILYQLLEFEPFRGYVGIDIGSGVTDERAARNISILSAVLGKYEYLHRVEVFSEKNIISAPEIFFNMYMRFLFEGGITEYEDDSEYAPSGCISFMTIHQSKGMEFPVVMVDSLSAVPRTQSDGVIEEIEKKYFHRPAFEAKEDIKFFDFWRLYYTAFSRAQNLLVLSCYEKNGIGRTPSKYFESCYSTLPSYNDIDLSKMELEMVKPVNIKKSFSFTSHIELYENCSLQYKFFKELGFTQIRVGATLFGTLVHETIEDVHRAAMRHEESTITPDNVRAWLDTNYLTLSKSEHSYLGVKQVDAAYRQVIAYVERMSNGTGLTGDGAVTGESLWSHIQDAEVDVSLVKPEYILKGTVDLIRGDGNTVEIVDFKSEKRPDLTERSEDFERYKRQLEVYFQIFGI